MAIVFFVMDASCLKIDAEENLKEATGCTFVLNRDYVPGGEKGFYVNRHWPMESSSVTYNVYDNGANLTLTNREKAQLGEVDTTVYNMEKLDKHKYESLFSAAYAAEYGGDVHFRVEAFKRIEIDGYPGYRIDASYEPEGSQPIFQTVFIIRSKYRTFTITYQRASDDECQESFDISADTIHVH